MPDRNIWLFTAAALVVVMLFFNRKVRLWAVLKEQIKVFKNAKKTKNFSLGLLMLFSFSLGIFIHLRLSVRFCH